MLETSSSVDLEAMRARVAEVRRRIAEACRRVGRSPEEVTLIAVSKTFPAAAVEAASGLGLGHFGENKVQELTAKSAAVPGAGAGGRVTWHMIGHLQRNKAKDVAPSADVFHALDSLRLADALASRLAAAGRTLPCFVQVNVSGEDSKFGVAPEAVHALLDDLARYEHLRMVGLMTLAAPAEDAEAVRPQFRQLRTLLESYDGSAHRAGAPASLSMGMSGDYEVAIEEGATHVRIGSALFGPRQ
jgi:pyridoxal phosphate enzyme (YggS family)